MRKHNEGYVLPLVLVVMIIMALIAVGVMSVSLHNLQTQKADIERMKDQYEAQGEIEKAVANLDIQLKQLNGMQANQIAITEEDIINTAESTILAALGVNAENACVKLLEAPEGVAEWKNPKWTENLNGALSCAISLYATDAEKQVRIDCTIFLENVIAPENNVYFYQAPAIIYTSYEIGGADVA